MQKCKHLTHPPMLFPGHWQQESEAEMKQLELELAPTSDAGTAGKHS